MHWIFGVKHVYREKLTVLSKCKDKLKVYQSYGSEFVRSHSVNKRFDKVEKLEELCELADEDMITAINEEAAWSTSRQYKT